ncbi:MAG: D-Ala-D-Ala carboxypeptidase family metallohydrolase [Pseudomonadota bacterium]
MANPSTPSASIGRASPQFLRTVFVMVAIAIGVSACASFPSLNPFSKGRVVYKATSWCLPWGIKRTLRKVASKYGDVVVYSTYRSPWYNRKVGGAKKSYHKKCRAADFKVRAPRRSVWRYLRRQRTVGGISYYRRTGHFHIDNGPKRSW